MHKSGRIMNNQSRMEQRFTVEKKIRAAVKGRRARAGVAPFVGVVVIEGEIQNGHGAQLLLVLLHPQLALAHGVACTRLHLHAHIYNT